MHRGSICLALSSGATKREVQERGKGQVVLVDRSGRGTSGGRHQADVAEYSLDLARTGTEESLTVYVTRLRVMRAAGPNEKIECTDGCWVRKSLDDNVEVWYGGGGHGPC